MKYTTGSSVDWLKSDLSKYRKDFGAIKAMCKARKTIPVFSAFLDPDGFYSQNQQQVINSSLIFGTVGSGEYGGFM